MAKDQQPHKNSEQLFDFGYKPNNENNNNAATVFPTSSAQNIPDFLNSLSVAEDVILPDPTKAREETLAKINAHYKQGIEYFRQGKLDEAEQELVQAMKPVLSKNTMRALYVGLEDCKEPMLNAMYHLGKIYERSEKYSDNYSKAAAIFQYCAGFAKKYAINTEVDFIKEAYAAEAKFLASIESGDKAKSHNEYQGKIDYYKGELEAIRSLASERLKKIEHLTIEQIAKRAKAVEEIYSDCTSFFINHARPSDSNSKQMVKPGLVQQLLAECYEQLGAVPQGCEHAIIGFGSLAGGKMTPWSDLEFGILINEDKAEYKEYFRNLTKLLHIKVINLGETPLRSIGIESLNNFKTAKASDDWFWDEVMTSGVSFDGAHWHACKLPLGRQGYKAEERVKDKDGIEKKVIVEKLDYELILTPGQMAEFQSNKPVEQGDGKQEVIDEQRTQANKSWYGSDKHLVQALKSVALIGGSQGLLDIYRKAAQVAEDKAIVQARALEILAEDVDNFSLKLGDEEEGKLFDVKKGIYRVGDRIIEALANYYAIEPEPGEPNLTVWQVIEKIAARGLLSLEGAEHLKEAISIATELRIATYCHNQGQKEGISTYVPAVEHLTEQQKKQILTETFFVKDTSILHHFYYVVLTLQDITQKLVDKQYEGSVESSLTFNSLINQSNHTKGLVHARFLEYKKALEHLQLATEEKPEDLTTLNDLFSLQYKTGKVDGALDIASQMLTLIKKKYKDNHLDIAKGYNNLGLVHNEKGEYDVAIKYYKQALEIRKQVYGSTTVHLDIADSYNKLGNVYNVKGEYDAAIECHKQALAIRKQIYGNTFAHSDIAMSYNNLGEVYRAKGEYDRTTKYHQQALEIQKQIYESNPSHPNIATSYNNLGIVYEVKGEYDEAIKYHHQALAIRKQIYGNTFAHSDIASSYNNLGNAAYAKGEYDEAIKYYKQALEIKKQVYVGNSSHPDIASSYNNLGEVYRAKGEYDRATKYHQQALDIQMKIYASNLIHPDIAMSYNNWGVAHTAKGEYDEAISCYQQALNIQMKVYASNPFHPDIATSYNNLGSIYYAKGEYDRATKYHQQALDIQMKVYASNPFHPDIATSYNNLGSIYYAKGEYDRAISCYQQALDIQMKVYASNSFHPDIATSYNNLGSIYYAKGEYDTAVKCHKQALGIQMKAYTSNPFHQDIAGSYNNLGLVYAAKGEYDAAIECHKQALKIREQVHASNLIHPDIADSYNNLGNVYNVKGEYDAAIECHKQALRIREQVPASNLIPFAIASSYNNLGLVYEAKGEYDVAIECHKQALRIREQAHALNLNHPDIVKSCGNLGAVYLCMGDFEKACFYSKNGHQQNISMAYRNYHASIMQLSILSFLKDDYDQAKKYLLELGSQHANINFFSEQFVKLIFAHVSFVYEVKALTACLNCQKALLKVDPELKYGNHYHNLACFYAAAGKVAEAHSAFKEALKHSPNVSLHVEYAQFILHNMDVKVEPQEALSHLRRILDSNREGKLQYGNLEKNSVCAVLKRIIEQKNSTIEVTPAVLAHYLLVKYAKYLGLDTKEVAQSLEELAKLSNALQDEVSFRLLADTCAEGGEQQQASEYLEYAELIDQIEKVTKGKVSAESMALLSRENVQKYADNVQKAVKLAVSENRLPDAQKLYEQVFNLQNSDLVKTLGLQIDSVTDEFATICLLNNAIQLFITLKIQFGAKVNTEIVKLAGKSVEEFLAIDSQMTEQIKAALLQKQLAINAQTATVEAIEDDQSVDDKDEIKALGEHC